MMSPFLLSYMLMYVSGFVTLCLNQKHLMMSLLSLELMILSMFCSFSFIILVSMEDMYMLLIFLGFSVCEGVMGLSCLISIIRSHGNDLLSSLSMKSC
uniref:NADH-ubiquinone oxidoreductase chain 4L n=1 Tax=Vagitanus terminalis TaxID=2170276 RepID=A0A344AM17_9HEMI|nr:NADH dehydrogenase subunit 4L [Vagitanus terminalis]